MIASVRGTMSERDTSSCVVEAGGIGYLLHVSTYKSWQDVAGILFSARALLSGFFLF